MKILCTLALIELRSAIILLIMRTVYRICNRWHFAQTSILEEKVRRKRNMWNWELMKEHRKTARKYKEAYKTKLKDAKKVPTAVPKTLEVILL